MTDENHPRAPCVLVVDDSPEVVAVLDRALRPGLRVRAATNAERALAIVEGADPPELILLDVMLPEMSGHDLCRRIKANPARRDIPIIFATALGEETDEQVGLELGAVDYITKPIRAHVVRARVQNHLELARARRALSDQNATLEREVVKRTAEIRESYLETIRLGHEVMARSNEWLGHHCARVASHATALCRQLGLDLELTFDVHVAALLHDLGLVGVPQAELRPAYLAPHQVADPTFRAHPQALLRALTSSSRFERTGRIVAAHHENLDGTGFPAGLAGDAIPMGARVLAVADRWDIFTQLEGKAAGREGFAELVARFAGQLDPDVLEAARNLFGSKDPFGAVVEKAPQELEPGMVLARSVRTTGGSVLLSAGTALRPEQLRGLIHFAQGGGVEQPILVYREAGA